MTSTIYQIPPCSVDLSPGQLEKHSDFAHLRQAANFRVNRESQLKKKVKIIQDYVTLTMSDDPLEVPLESGTLACLNNRVCKFFFFF